MLTDKFLYHLPLCRQLQRLKAAGIEVSRESLTNWSMYCSTWAAPGTRRR